MRLLICSDIHGNQYAWRAFLKQVSKINYDHMVFLGDIFGYYYGQNEIIKDMSAIKGLIWLKGNHDQYFLDLVAGKTDTETLTARYGSTYQEAYAMSEWAEKIASLPFSYSLKADGLELLFCHGTPENPSNGRCYPRDDWSPLDCLSYDVVICGHTHFRMVRRGDNRQWLNTGSLGQPRDGNASGFLLYDTKSREYEYVDVPYDQTELFQEIQEKDPGFEKLIEVLKRKRV